MAEGVSRSDVEELIDLAVGNQQEARRRLNARPELIASRYIHGETPLHFCGVEGYSEAVVLLAEMGMPVDAVNEFGDTALVEAASLGNVEVVRVLLQHGADANRTSPTRDCPLHAAASSGAAEVVELLLDAGARPDYTTSINETIWDAVAWAGARGERISKLLEARGIQR